VNSLSAIVDVCRKFETWSEVGKLSRLDAAWLGATRGIRCVEEGLWCRDGVEVSDQKENGG
jgi:hypothetical protein